MRQVEAMERGLKKQRREQLDGETNKPGNNDLRGLGLGPTTEEGAAETMLVNSDVPFGVGTHCGEVGRPVS